MHLILPAEDLSNCVSTSHSIEALDPTPVKDRSVVVLQATGVPTTASATVLPPLLSEGWDEERVQMRSRRRRKEQEHEEEGEVEKVKVEALQSLEGRQGANGEEIGEGV
ncbi:unnamed protein product [Hydatigera taeniaeformis]|uniref:Uncharacterized protein n=1 Tax=Hydatigena taeniaeformis TaxID=6205 RepID=A0A0R3WUL6_HYDTA|nr:unnamed protein product [Hydatigera taeniaeformis]